MLFMIKKQTKKDKKEYSYTYKQTVLKNHAS